MRKISDLANDLFPLSMGSSFQPTIAEAVNLQAQCHFHYPSSGEIAVQQCSDMALPFLEAFDGVKFVEGNPVITGDLKVKPETDIAKLPVVREIAEAKQVIDGLGHANKYAEFRQLKTSVTALDVLIRRVEDDSGLPIREVLMRFAEGIELFATLAAKNGSGYLSFDMPFWTRSSLFHQEIIEVTKLLFARLRVSLPKDTILAVHACGVHSQQSLMPLLELDVDLLDFEFAAKDRRENFNIITNNDLISHNKNIKVGIVTRTYPFVEAEQDIRSQVERVLRTYDPGIVVFGPDCSMRDLALNVGRGKLERLQFAREIALDLYQA